MSIKYNLNRWLTVLILIFSSPVYAGSLILGLNLEFIDGQFDEEAFDGGFGIQAGYEFKETKNWQYGFLFEYLDGWNSEKNLTYKGEMMYKSKSLFATARPRDWPLVFKAGIVNADYKVVLQDNTINYRSVSDTGYAYGIGLSFGNENYRVNVLDVKKIHIGNDSFLSYGITLSVLVM
jgi:hypothetical protein